MSYENRDGGRACLRRMRPALLAAAVLAAIGGAALALTAGGASADEWPSHPVRIVVPYAAGGAADTLGRLYGDALSAAFGQQFYVENRTGAGGVIAAEE